MTPDPLTLPLRDIHLPAAVAWWPPAPGWWLLLLLVVALTAGILAWLRLRMRYRLRKASMAQLERILTEYQREADTAELTKQLSTLLRRVALSRYPRADVASLTGSAWLAFLDKAYGGDGFTTGAGRCLADAPYRQSPTPGDAEGSQLLALCASWVKTVSGPAHT